MKVAKTAAKKIKSTAQKPLKKAQAQASRVKRTLDDVLIDSEHLKSIRQQIQQRKKRIEKESELATTLAFKVLDRAKKMRQKLERKARKSGSSAEES